MPPGHGADDPEARGPQGRFADDLVGLDPQDPEVRRFAEHLDKIEHPNSPATVEGMLRGVGDFADGANRAGGHRRLVVALIVLLVVGPSALMLVWTGLRLVAEALAG
ncbi:hypothetical protein INP57_17470 [Saccharopolyspora sp. HNM0986]|uniref:hypothetical protein n=1 Tax=Saccharopolyspora galaxeae TaxID=2781241 RepID=UPI00190A7E18|nr:hypothetical protein [Saccharopolyspora sp. HNM0986]MBK0868607.1 hypothetical protein [Saccharopolyspora sp. HNM0986]